MSDGFREIVQAWTGQAVVVHYDQPSGAWFFIAVHDTTLGRAVGGCRMQAYPSPEAGLVDAMRLAEGMTYKWASVGVPFGGGKSVLAVPGPVEGERRISLLTRFGALLEALAGTFTTGVDMGTTPEDMKVLAGTTRHVLGQVDGGRTSMDPGPFTALGVLIGARVAVEHCFGGDRGLAGRSVLVQGVGDVGEPLAWMLAEAGASVLISDIDTERARRLAAELSCPTVSPDRVYETACDVYAPCAVGGTLNRETIETLDCRIVAGSANNQLGAPEDAQRLHEKGVLYMPDYVVNAGGAISFALLHEGEQDETVLRTRVEQIGRALREILAEAAARCESPEKAARRKAERALRRAGQQP